MSPATIDERLTRVEQLMDELVRKANGAERPKDWRRTIGMFDGDPVMKQIEEAGRKIREAERRKARARRPSRRRAKQ